jgi:hypothetical protein
LSATAAPATRHVARISISDAVATTAPPRLIARVSIGRLKRATTAGRSAPIAWFIARIRISFAAAARFGRCLVLARQIRFCRRRRFPPLRQSTAHRHSKPGPGQAQHQQTAPQGRIGGL